MNTLHYWLAIEALNQNGRPTGEKAYVDDGFMDGNYVHSARPFDKRSYERTCGGDGIEEHECSPPPAYDSQNREVGR